MNRGSASSMRAWRSVPRPRGDKPAGGVLRRAASGIIIATRQRIVPHLASFPSCGIVSHGQRAHVWRRAIPTSREPPRHGSPSNAPGLLSPIFCTVRPWQITNISIKSVIAAETVSRSAALAQRQKMLEVQRQERQLIARHMSYDTCSRNARRAAFFLNAKQVVRVCRAGRQLFDVFDDEARSTGVEGAALHRT